MQARQIMSKEVFTVPSNARLSEAARVMWEHDCGFVPVVDADTNVLAGVLTDRDLCMAGYIKGRAPQEIPVAEVMSKTLFTAKPEEELWEVHATMREHQVHRLPIVDRAGKVLGVVSLNDLACGAKDDVSGLTPRETFETLKALCIHRPAGPAPQPRAARKAVQA